MVYAWLLVRTIAHDLHASVIVASYTLHNNTCALTPKQKQPGCKNVQGQSEARL